MTIESCPNNSIGPTVHSPQGFTCPYIASFRNSAGATTAHICFEENWTSAEFKCIYSSEGYTNTYGEVVAGREIGQCLYMDGGRVIRVDKYGTEMDGECPAIA